MAYLLTEDNIKHCTLGYLKTYYKNNSSRGFGATEAKLDMVTANGIVADGFLKFTVQDESNAFNWNELIDEKKQDNKDKKQKKEAPRPKEAPTAFLATFEASSQDTAEEIQYNVQNTLLFLDGLAVAFMVAAGCYGFNYFKDQFTLNELGFMKFWMGFLAVLLASLIGYLSLIHI